FDLWTMACHAFHRWPYAALNSVSQRRARMFLPPRKRDRSIEHHFQHRRRIAPVLSFRRNLMIAHGSTDFIRRLSRVAFAPLLGLAIATYAFADEGFETPGVPPGNTLPPQAQGNGPPPWTGDRKS